MKHTIQLEVHSPDEVPEAGVRVIAFHSCGFSEMSTGGSDHRATWEQLRTPTLGRGPITHWSYWQDITPPPSPKPVQVTMRPGTEIPTYGDMPIVACAADGCVGTWETTAPPSMRWWFPKREALPREPWRHDEDFEMEVAGNAVGVVGGIGVLALPQGHGLSNGTRVEVTVSMREVLDGE